jgi:hypothetical protein
MPITRCPRCGYNQLFERRLLGEPIACTRCDNWFPATERSRGGRVRDLLFVVAAVALGAAVSWLILR